jgi:thiamine-phosphate pyrophosphorylase
MPWQRAWKKNQRNFYKKEANFIYKKMELMVISHPDAVIDEPLLINNLFLAGLSCLHIRKPAIDVKSFQTLINGIAPRFYHRISLHQWHELAADYGITRLHYTERHRLATSEKSRKEQKNAGYRLSTSIHDLTLLPSLTDFDYTFYGPVFPSLSKPGYESRVPTDFKLDKAEAKTKVIALGGITPARLPILKTMNFDGAAVLGALWNQPQLALATFLQCKAYLTTAPY